MALAVVSTVVSLVAGELAYRALLRAVTAWGGELGIETVDLMPFFQGHDHTQFWLPADGHPNARAHEVVAGVLRDRLLAALRPGPATTAAAGGAPAAASATPS